MKKITKSLLLIVLLLISSCGGGGGGSSTHFDGEWKVSMRLTYNQCGLNIETAETGYTTINQDGKHIVMDAGSYTLVGNTEKSGFTVSASVRTGNCILDRTVHLTSFHKNEGNLTDDLVIRCPGASCAYRYEGIGTKLDYKAFNQHDANLDQIDYMACEQIDECAVGLNK